MTKEHFQTMAQYNQWMNNRLYACAAQLGEAQLKEDRGAFFKSILGTLNHIMVADIIWLLRFAQHPSGFQSLDYIRSLESPASLDAQIFSSLDELREEREKLDLLIIELVDEATEADLASRLDYQNTKGKQFTDLLSQLLQHLFNHQTHHRGQLTTLFNQIGIDVGATDLIVMWRNLEQKPASRL